MAEENQVTKEPKGEAAQLHSGAQPAQQITKQPQRVMKELERVTTKNPKKVEAGKMLAESNRKKREVKKREEQVKLEASGNWRPVEIGGQWKLEASKPILRNWGCLSSGSYRWSWLSHL